LDGVSSVVKNEAVEFERVVNDIEGACGVHLEVMEDSVPGVEIQPEKGGKL